MLAIRRASAEDCKLLWEWANDPQVRGASFNSKYISLEEHVAWFTRKMSDPTCHLYIILYDDAQPIGQVRFEITRPDTAVVSISIANDERSRGYSAQALELGLKRFSGLTRTGRVIAYVKPENTRSIHMFEKAGFRRMAERIVKGQSALEFLWERKYVNGRSEEP